MEAMAMTKPKSRWTDERIDDMKETVDRVDSRTDSLHRTMLIGFFSLGTMMFAGFGAMITLFATHF
jgi:hypothetical protein